MTQNELIKTVNAKEATGIKSDINIYSICASDLMSEVLMIAKPHCLIVTNLVNMQTIRTAEMVESAGILFVRDKYPTEEMVRLACRNSIPLYVTSLSLFEACGKLYDAGLKPGNGV